MNWISSLQKAIDYVEEHITEKIDYEKVAKEACSSAFHFQRIFGIMCGITLGDYIRMRRLTLAAQEIMNTDKKIIDIALDYGYDSPESFTRAFSKFHGVTPTEVRSGATITAFSRLSVKLILSGGNLMNYRIEKKDAFKVVCKRKQVEKPGSDVAATDIREFWEECGQNGSMAKIMKYMPKNSAFGGLLGICFTSSLADNHFPYGIGFEYEGQENVDSELDIIEIPAHTFAVFTCKGKMPEAFVETYKKICSEFFPQSDKYEYAHGVELEVYPSDKIDDPNYTCEIWIAVNEK